MHVSWQTFEHAGQIVEAQFFAPHTKSDRLILMCSGFPGLGATRFEQRHAAAIVEYGATLGVIKHAGTRLDSPDAPFTVNNAARLMKARQKGETHLGGGPSTMAAWLKEPQIVLDALRNAFARIDIIGNSFGAVAALWSLTQEDAPLDKIQSLLLYAGAQGVDTDPMQGIMRVWNPMFLAAPAIAERIEIDAPMTASMTMKDAYAHIAAKSGDLPAHINLKYLVVTADEILKVSDSEDFRDTVMKGRGEIILNTTCRAYPAHGLLAHDTPDYPTEKLMELLQ